MTKCICNDCFISEKCDLFTLNSQLKKDCSRFMDKTKYIKLPCAIGDMVYPPECLLDKNELGEILVPPTPERVIGITVYEDNRFEIITHYGKYELSPRLREVVLANEIDNIKIEPIE